MIEFLVADALEPGTVVLLPWPDWGWRRFVVCRASPYRDIIDLDVQAADGEDAGIRHQVTRRKMEPMHVVVKSADALDVCLLDGCDARAAPRTGQSGSRPGYCCEEHRRAGHRANERERYRMRKAHGE